MAQNKQKQRRAIRAWINLFFTINIFLVVFNYGWTLLSNTAAERDAVYVNISKANEYFLDKLGLIISSIAAGDDELREVLKKNVRVYETNLNALLNGGQISLEQDVIQISASRGTSAEKLREIDRQWLALKPQLLTIVEEPAQVDSIVAIAGMERPIVQEVQAPDSLSAADSLGLGEVATTSAVAANSRTIRVPNPRAQRAYVYAQGNLEELLTKSRELTKIYAGQLRDSQSNIQVVQFIAVLLNLGLLAFGAFNIIIRFINPLGKLALTAQDVAQGDVNAKVDYNRNNEIGTLADSLNLVVESFKKYAEFANNIGKEKFDTDFKVNSEKDTLGYALLGMRDSLRTVAEEDYKRNWANEGFTLFSNILRNTSLEMKELSYEIISNLVKYIDANQGGLFLLIDDEDSGQSFLELQAAFAYNKRKYEDRTVRMGQGLLGQAVLEKEITYLDKIPQDYIRIGSGLGESRPSVLLIAPLIFNEKVVGAIEIASFQAFKDYEVKFITEICETIASTISSVKINENTKRLLEESELNAEKMKEQEEEMKQNLEILAATQDEMQRNQETLEQYKHSLEAEVQNRTQELQVKEKELSNTLVQLRGIMESTTAGVVALNPAYEVISYNTQMAELVEKFYQNTIQEGALWSEVIQNDGEDLLQTLPLWKSALQGESSIIETAIRDPKDTQIYWYEIVINPIQTESGELIGASMFIRDISNRKQAQRAVERTARILDNSTNEVYLFRADDYRFVNVNERGRRALGYTLEELQEMPFYVLELSFDKEGFEQFVQPLREGDTTNLLFETVYQRKDGSTYDVEVNMQLFADENPPIFAAIAQDISERKLKEQDLEEAITRFNLVTAAAREGLWEIYVENADEPLSQDNQFWWSRQCKSLLGFEDRELGNTIDSWSSLLHPEDKERIVTQLAAHISDRSGQTPYEVEYRMLTKSGEYLWFSSSAATLRDADGKAMRMAGAIRDISRRKKAEQNLLEQMAQNETILNAAFDCIVAIDMRGRIFSINKALEDVFGYEESELIGKNVKILMPDEQAAGHDRHMKTYHETGVKKIIGKVRREHARKKDGTIFPIEISISEGNVGNRRFYIGILRDISDLEAQTRELLWQAQRMEALSEVAREGFVFHQGGNVRDINLTFSELSGYGREELLDTPLLSLFEEADHRAIQQLLIEDTATPVRLPMICQDKTKKMVELSNRSVVFEGAVKEYILSVYWRQG
ncbi:PAS domain S-box protein [Eisenibacter elegans]|uniref:PAS domain S-box protein n=1 Tax=Eisenibacter elegans TaxID=997 RepID=UPI0006875225|nr:PAS domain S-box protein [Eisenibacter elegans]